MQDALQQVNDGNGGFGMKDMENELRVLEDRLDAEDDDELFCVACNKEMRNEKAFASHRKQKKHLENVERLRETLLKDELISSDELKDDSDNEAQEAEEHISTDEDDNIKEAPTPEKIVEEEDVSKNNKSAKRKTKSRRNKNSKPVSKSTVELNTELGCVVCKKEFPSKNKLFKHLKETGHSVALS